MKRTVTINGTAHSVDADVGVSLLEVLRDELQILGPKFACGEGACGACTVLVGREAVTACRFPAAEVLGRQVITVEGLAEDGVLHPIQQACLEFGALQCGFCTAGWLVEAAALLARTPEPSDAQIASALEGHICRCGTYSRIVLAVRRAAELLATYETHEAPEAHLAPGPDPKTDATQRFPWSIGHELHWTASKLGPAPQPLDLAPAGARPFFDHLCDGLVVSVEATDSSQAEEHWTTTRTAWVHVGADGMVTAFTGKVELGQGTRTALSGLVAESLGVPLSSVSLVMGDTDVSPYDLGTFGSRSMPDAAPHLRRAAEAARRFLCEAAAEQLGLAADDLELTESGVTSNGGAREVGYGELLGGVRRVEVVPNDAPVTHDGAWKIAGESTPAIGAKDVVTGRRRYPSDLSLPGMLHGCVLRAPAFGSVLADLDTTGAEAMPGVTVVRDGSVVGVCAADHRRARQALRAIKSTWALTAQPGHDELEGYLRAHLARGEGFEARFEHGVGDVPAALASCPVVAKATYTTAYIAHLPLEPCVALAEWQSGRVTVWTGTQTPFRDRLQVATRLGVDENQVRIVVPDFGAAFGGRQRLGVSLEAAMLARAVGRPVRVQWSRWEELMGSHFRPAAVIDVTSGIDGSGSLSAWSFTNLNSGASGIVTPYRVPNQHIAYTPAASPLPQGPYRALAATANHFARESHMDEIAHRLGADPLDWRLGHLDDERLIHVLRTAAEHIGWGDDDVEPGSGLGIACGSEKGGRAATAAAVKVDREGRLSVERLVTVFDSGRIVNPGNLANQVEGAAWMGLGGALFEAVELSAGKLENASFSAYRVPRLTDLAELEVVLVDRPELAPAGGGETPIIGVAPAIANAIFAATGARLRSLPLAPGGIVVRA